MIILNLGLFTLPFLFCYEVFSTQIRYQAAVDIKSRVYNAVYISPHRYNFEISVLLNVVNFMTN